MKSARSSRRICGVSALFLASAASTASYDTRLAPVQLKKTPLLVQRSEPLAKGRQSGDSGRLIRRLGILRGGSDPDNDSSLASIATAEDGGSPTARSTAAHEEFPTASNSTLDATLDTGVSREALEGGSGPIEEAVPGGIAATDSSVAAAEFSHVSAPLAAAGTPEAGTATALASSAPAAYKVSAPLSKAARRATKYGSFALLVMQNSALTCTMRWSRAHAGDRPLYATSTAVVLSEVAKILISTVLLLVDSGSWSNFAATVRAELLGKPDECLKLLLPGLLYTLQVRPRPRCTAHKCLTRLPLGP